ncbi:MAG: reactive intermediate/imine deaminase [Pseudonocardiales bacterium]|nr:MAG: reactive intermediate/imine deaminase [Pseudonocardiales bacterium]
MHREIATADAPPALGPYSQAVAAGSLVFCSGTAGIDPSTGEVREGIRAQTEQALVNVAAILRAAGASMDDVVKTTVMYKNVDDFATINETYATHFSEPYPARSAPSNVHLPKGLLLSIDVIAVLPTHGSSSGEL